MTDDPAHHPALCARGLLGAAIGMTNAPPIERTADPWEEYAQAPLTAGPGG